jgi:hypothetical protein
MTTRRRAPRDPRQQLTDGNRAQRTASAGIVYNAAPISDHASAVAQAKANVADVTQTGSQIDMFLLDSGGAQDLDLSYLPKDESWNVSLNGIVALDNTDYTIDGQTLSLLSPLDAVADDWVRIQYDYLTGQPVVIDEIPTGMLLWLRATDLGGVDNSTVTTWEDQSGNSNDGTGAGDSGAKPVLKTAQTPDGGPAVYVDSTSSNRRITFADFLTGTAAAEVFVVIRAVSDPAPGGSPAVNNGFWRFGSAGGGSSAAHYPFTDGVIYDDFGSNSRKTVGNPSDALTDWHVYNVSSASAAWTSRLDGTVLYTTATNTVSWDTVPKLGIGYTSGADQVGQFYFAELIIYPSVLGTDERTTVLEYLAGRHGITL